jgi:predicted nucleotide-binding protein (sugar kinase/HSP70/actin superfamily)
VLQGGTQRNLAAVKAEVDFIRDSFRGQDQEPEILLHPHAGEAGAIGAALEAIRLCRDRRTTFVGLDLAERTTFSARSSEQTRCHYCTNECLRTFIDVHVEGAADRQLVVASCEKGTAEDLGAVRQIAKEMSAVKARTPNLVALAAREVWKPARPPMVADTRRRFNRRVSERRSALRIGIPRVFNMYALAPLFSGYLESLGLSHAHIVYSDFTTNELYREGSGRGAIDPCFPSKVALSHVHNLLQVKHAQHPLDAIFFPMIDVLPPRFTHVVGSNACPTVALTPQTVRAAFTKDRDEFADRAIRYLDPLLNLADRPLFERQMYETWHRLLGLSRGENERALACGFAALSAYDARIRLAAREALEALEADGRIGIVLLGRVYHHDPGLNHGIAEELQKLGYPVFSQATLPLDADLLERLFGAEVRQGIIADPLDIHDVWKPSFSASSNAKVWAAKFAARHPGLAVVELSNFKCGHDAPIYATVENIVESSGTPYFAFKDIDENRPAASIKLRLETLHYALGRHRERMMARRRAEARVQRALTRYEARLRRAVRTGSRVAEPEDAPATAR